MQSLKDLTHTVSGKKPKYKVFVESGNSKLSPLTVCLTWCYHSVQFSSRWYLRAWKSPYALHPVSQKFPQRCLWNGSNVRPTDDGPLWSFRGRSSSASFHASLLQAIDGAMSLALCPQVASQASQHFRSSKKQGTCEGCLSRQSICSVISLQSGMSRAVHP